MTLYKYKAKNLEGKIHSGVLEVASEHDLYARLKGQGLFLFSSKVSEKSAGRKLKAKQLTDFNRSLGMLLQSGVSLVRALGIVANEETKKAQEKAVYEAVLKSIRQGTPLSTAMEEQGNCFPPLMIFMYRSAEASGSMDQVALRMAEHYEKEYRLKAKVSGAMVYPGILCTMIVLVVCFIFSFVLPQFDDMFAQMESLPFLTTMMMGISTFIRTRWYILVIALVVLIPSFIGLFRIPRVKFYKDKIKLKMPVFGKLLRVLYSARFSRTLSSLYSAGLPMIMALQISKSTVGNCYIEEQFDAAIKKIRAGQNLSAALGGVDGFVKKMVSSIMIGEETGSLDAMLDSTADTLDYEAQMAINKMVSFMEPALIIIMAVIVGVVMVSVIAPIYGSYNAIGASSY
ncbi:MAG: type II secretion system F family protein [Lachnospiraceae bacterium]|nr:type II secretion system F family protein [Lachnospiraceae bacterium]